MSIRKPTVAGSFYPGTKSGLTSLIDKLLKSEEPRIKLFPQNCNLVEAVVPHAGYIYSGYEALHFFFPLSKYEQKFETIIILNPDHRGMGNEISLDENSEWETPLGKVSLDAEFSKFMNLEINRMAHSYEHSGEVIVPFLQYYLNFPFQILPVTISRQRPEVALKLSKSIFEAVQKTNRKILIIASSDFSHYLPANIGAEKDDLALKEISNLDSEELYKTIKENSISVCGYGPIMTLIEYSKLIDKKVKAEILVRGHSGKSGNSSSVVDYNTILFYY